MGIVSKGTEYITYGGDRVDIFTTDGPSALFPVIGMRYSGSGKKEILTWTKEGYFGHRSRASSSHDLDLVAVHSRIYITEDLLSRLLIEEPDNCRITKPAENINGSWAHLVRYNEYTGASNARSGKHLAVQGGHDCGGDSDCAAVGI